MGLEMEPRGTQQLRKDAAKRALGGQRNSCLINRTGSIYGLSILCLHTGQGMTGERCDLLCRRQQSGPRVNS